MTAESSQAPAQRTTLCSDGLSSVPISRIAPVVRSSRRVLLEFGTCGELHLEGRALSERRFDPNTAAVHLDDLLGDGEPKASPALGLSVGTVDLMELLEDARMMFVGNAWPRIFHADVEVAVDRL